MIPSVSFGNAARAGTHFNDMVDTDSASLRERNVSVLHVDRNKGTTYDSPDFLVPVGDLHVIDKVLSPKFLYDFQFLI